MPEHWGHTVQRLDAPPEGPKHVMVTVFAAGQSRDAAWAVLMARAAQDPNCTGDPLGFTARALPAPKDRARPLEVTVYWRAEPAA